LSLEKHIAPTLPEPQRLSDYTVGIFQLISSRKGIKKAIKKGWITIDGQIGHSGDFIHGGEQIILNIEEDKKPKLELNLEILFEDDHLAIINKPAGITVSGNKSYTIERALSHNLNISSQIDTLSDPEPIHRLDHPTSGLLLIGKTRSTTIALNKLFESRSVRKIYHAISIGHMPHKGVIESLIDNKPSKSTFTVIQSLSSNKFKQLNLVELHPHTGRRHQLRKHLTSINSPILGDPLYFINGLLLKGKGLYLHASSLEFEHPITRNTIKVKCELPKKFTKIFNQYP